MRALSFFSLLLTLGVAITGCRLAPFDELADDAPVVTLTPGAGYPQGGYGQVLIAYEGQLDGADTARIAVSAGPGTPYAVHDAWSAGTIGDFNRRFKGCDDIATDMPDCDPGAGAALAYLPQWMGRRDCLMYSAVNVGVGTSPGEGQLRAKCEGMPGTFALSRVEGVDYGMALATMPAGSVLAGSTMLLDGTVDGDYGYPHNDYYSIEEIEPAKNGGSVLVFRKQSLVFASLNLETVNNEDSTARLYWNHTLAGKAGNLSYRGRAVVASGGAADESSPVLALVRRIDARDLALSRVDRLSAGQRVDVLVAKPGDVVSIPTSVTFTAVPGRDGVWRIRTTTPLRVTPPKAAAPVAVPAGESFLDASGSLLPAPRA